MVVAFAPSRIIFDLMLKQWSWLLTEKFQSPVKPSALADDGLEPRQGLPTGRVELEEGVQVVVAPRRSWRPAHLSAKRAREE